MKIISALRTWFSNTAADLCLVFITRGRLYDASYYDSSLTD